MSELHILVTGVTGSVGDALVPRLLQDGHRVRGFARSPGKVEHDIEVVEGDATTGEGLEAAMGGIDVAYFLIHSMEGSDKDFDETEHRTAELFVKAARHANVRRIVFLGGIVPEGGSSSEHLKSRQAVEEVLLQGAPEAVALRASMVIADGSRSFDFLASLVEKLPIVALPAWRSNKTRPIDQRDVVEYLAQAGTTLELEGWRVFDIGGATEVSYGEMVTRIGELAGTPRHAVGLPFSATPVASRVASIVAGEDRALIEPLMHSLEFTLIPDDGPARAAFDVEPRSFDESVEWALSQRSR